MVHYCLTKYIQLHWSIKRLRERERERERTEAEKYKVPFKRLSYLREPLTSVYLSHSKE